MNILIKNGIIVRSSNGYIDPETHFVVGHYRTKGGASRVYIEDMYADKAKKLYLKGQEGHMAKITKAVSLKNAEINMEDMTITETTKDDIKVYSLDKLLSDWNHISGISLTIKQDDEIPANEQS